MQGYASIVLYGDELNFHEIAKTMGIKSDSVRRKGAHLALGRSVPTDVWSYSSRQQRRGKAPDKPFDYLLKKMLRNGGSSQLVQLLPKLGVQKISLTMLLDVVGTHTAFKINQRHLRLAMDLNADVFFDLWRTKYRDLPLIANHEQIAADGQIHLHYGSDCENCDFTINRVDIVRYVQQHIEPIIHVW
jgi:hypothetical protein